MFTDVATSLGFPPLAYVVVALALTLMVTSWMQSPRNLPPCPVRPYPIVGHLPYLRKRPREALKEFRKKAGDIFSLYSGRKLTIVLNGYDLIKETLVKQADVFSGRPDNLINSLEEDGKREFTCLKTSIKMHSVLCSLKIVVYTDELAKLKGKPQEVRTLTNTAVSNIICSIIVGKRFHYDDPIFNKFMHILNEIIVLTQGVTISSSFPWLIYLPGDLFKLKKLVKNSDELKIHFCYPFIQLFSKKLEEGEGDDDSSASFITSYLKEFKRKEASGEPTTMEVAELVKIIQNLFIAGTETTSTTMLWFMIYMLHYPDVQKKVFKEIDDTVGTARAVSLQDKAQLNYLNATIKETQRLSSIVPLNLFHVNNVEVNIRGYTIPAGTDIMPNLDSILHDEKVWGDPMNFRPERFLDTTGKVLHPEEFVPFSLGRRVCIGEALATMELFLFLASLVQRFELLPATSNSLPPLNYSFGITCPPEDFEIRFVERKHV